MVTEDEWPRVRPENVESVRAQVRLDLSEIKASSGQSVLAKLENSSLTERQVIRVLDALGEVREHYARFFKTDGDQLVNWIHTQGELGRVIDAAGASGLGARETEDALLASMFSDSLKTKANFTVHHLAGEHCAEYILKEKVCDDFPHARLKGILHAIREHQVAPPGFMAMIYAGAIRKSVADEKRSFSKEEACAFASLFKKMSNPFQQELKDAPDGGKMLALTDDETALLVRTGNDKWYVPSEGEAWHKITCALIDGDGIDNYATPGGLSKIIQIRGPETNQFFKDGNFRYENPGRKPGQKPNSSQESWRDSFADFSRVASPAGLKIARSIVRESERAAIKAQKRVDEWLRQELNLDPGMPLPTIPGWTASPMVGAVNKPTLHSNNQTIQDSSTTTKIRSTGGTKTVSLTKSALHPDNLKYPDYDQKWWNIHIKAQTKRTPEEKAFYEDPANRYRGLSEQEIADFKLALKIRDRYAAELRKEQRIEGDAASDYEAVQTDQPTAEKATDTEVDRILTEMHEVQYTAMAYALSGETLPDELAKQYAKLEHDLEEKERHENS